MWPRNIGNGLPLAAAPLCAVMALAIAACAPAGGTSAARGGKALTSARDSSELLLADFEKPDDAVRWLPGNGSSGFSGAPGASPDTQPSAPPAPDTMPRESTTQPVATQPAPTPILRRSSLRPQAGLWAMSATLADAGEVRRVPPAPFDLRMYSVVTVQIAQAGLPAQNGDATAAIVLTDADGKHFESDAYPVKSNWRGISLDLDEARADGLDAGHIASVGVLFRPAKPRGPAAAKTQPAQTPVMLTDSWVAQRNDEKVAGEPDSAKGLFISKTGTSLTVHSEGRFEITLTDRGSLFADGKAQAPGSWLRITPARGGPGIPPGGLMLLDSDAFESLADFRETGPDDANGKGTGGVHPGWHLPEASWPATFDEELSQIKWDVVWTSPIAAIIEGKQENGPYDKLGEPAVQVAWRLMIYQWGQVFVHVEWSTSGEMTVPEPITWALMQNDNRHGAGVPLGAPDPAGQHRVQELIYPATLRQGLSTALPHRMQTDAPISMIARTNARKDTWWWASGKVSEASPDYRRYFGAGIVPATAEEGRRRADCMLLVNGADALLQAACFAQYLVPPKVIVRQGELDQTYPGDVDGDGFVEPYGFQAIRLANGRATFTVYPQDRPIFVPAFLFTVPAAERDGLDLKHSRMLITIDGKLFADPPQFPDGSFLLQIPYEIDQPVSIEAIVVKK